MMKAYRVVVAVLVLALMCAVPVHAEGLDDPIITPFASSFFASYGISLGNPSGSTIHITMRVSAVETMAQLGGLTYDVQRRVNGTWITVADDLTGSIGTNTASYTFAKNYTAVSGYAYRVKVKFYAKKYDGTSSSSTVTSSSISV